MHLIAILLLRPMLSVLVHTSMYSSDGGRAQACSETLACRRFDILCVVKDTVDPILDERLARFVIGSHERSHPDADVATAEETAQAASFAGGPPPKTISQDLLRKYITYAKDNCRPRLSSADYDKLATVSPCLELPSSAASPPPMNSHPCRCCCRPCNSPS